MPTASLEINVADKDLTSRLTYRLAVRRVDGAALPDHLNVLLTLEGAGSLASGHSAKEVRRDLGDPHADEVAWYRRGIFGRDLKATLSASIDSDDYEISLLPYDAPTETWIGYEYRRTIRLPR